ncbi:MAG: SDR family NAD(P)-dependent oxidoreductase [Oscillospiraceae bacterium]|nr:SDR family NAD(P)-dependent oxidoreductase [Oscillospiraceae bacterium]
MTLSEAKSAAKKNINTRPATTGRLAGKIAVVTGSAQGFGLGIAQELHANGAAVVIADLESQRETALRIASELGGHAAYIPVDVSDEASVESMVCETVARFGGLDIMVSNAGVTKAGSLRDMDLASFELLTKINYTGYFLCAKYASEIMIAQYEADSSRFSDIIQVNSKSGLAGSKNNFAYSGGKFGGIGLTQSFALELARYNIKVNAVCPGNYYEGPLWANPERGLLRQFLDAGKAPGAETVEDVKRYYLSKQPMNARGCLPSDVAKAIMYCVEQLFETGQALPVTGGQIMLG